MKTETSLHYITPGVEVYKMKYPDIVCVSYNNSAIFNGFGNEDNLSEE